MRRSLFAAVVALAVMVGGTVPASATTIQFAVTDLPDVPGGDLWQYDYFVADGSLSALQGFVVFFDEILYSDLAQLALLPADWDLVLLQPDTVLDADGTYDALALVDSPLFVGPFSVSFLWLGPAGTTPGSQPFELYNLDPSGDPVPFDAGLTSPVGGAAIPEPGTLLLMATGAVAGRAMRRRRGPLPLTTGIAPRATVTTHHLE